MGRTSRAKSIRRPAEEGIAEEAGVATGAGVAIVTGAAIRTGVAGAAGTMGGAVVCALGWAQAVRSTDATRGRRSTVGKC